MSGKFENLGSNMYALIRQGDDGYDNSVFGIEHEAGRGIWVYNNDGEPIINLDEMKQLRDILNNIIDYEERFQKINDDND